MAVKKAQNVLMKGLRGQNGREKGQNVLMKGLSGQSGSEKSSKCLHERFKRTKRP